MLERWRSFRDTIDETTSTIRLAVWVVIVLAGVYVAFGKWWSSLSMGQQIAFWVVIGGLAIVVLTYLMDWRRKRGIDRIPDLLAVIDQLTMEYIDEFSPEEISEDASDSLARILGINISRLRVAVENGDEKQIDEEYQKVWKQYDRFLSPKNRIQDALQDLLYMSAFLDTQNMGLKRVTNTQKYHRLRNRVKSLQKMVPSANINLKVNEYWRWSEGLYCIALTTKPIMLVPNLKKKMPPKLIASAATVRPTIEQATSILISQVRESIINYKERNIDRTDRYTDTYTYRYKDKKSRRLKR